jgi:nicotinate-nucleotide pyrophosphorylase
MIFDKHMQLSGGIDGFITQLLVFRRRLAENKITVEVRTGENAVRMAGAGVNIIQLDKLGVSETEKAVKEVKSIAPQILGQLREE